MDGNGPNRRAGCLLIIVVTVVAWALIAWAASAWMGKPEMKPDTRTACERSNPPWAIAERCR